MHCAHYGRPSGGAGGRREFGGGGGGSVGDSGKGMCTLQALSLREGSPQQSELRPTVLSSGPGQRGR